MSKRYFRNFFGKKSGEDMFSEYVAFDEEFPKEKRREILAAYKSEALKVFVASNTFLRTVHIAGIGLTLGLAEIAGSLNAYVGLILTIFLIGLMSTLAEIKELRTYLVNYVSALEKMLYENEKVDGSIWKERQLRTRRWQEAFHLASSLCLVAGIALLGYALQ